MGDRAQVKILPEFGQHPLFLYTHNGGTDLINTVHTVLTNFPGRHDDESYLASILLRHMHHAIYPSSIDLLVEYGTGIDGFKHGDLAWPLIVISCKDQTMWLEHYGGENDERLTPKVTFQEFIDDASLLTEPYKANG